MTAQPEHVLIVGAGLGGLRTAEQLRAAGYQGRISLVGEEVHPPYDRPPLSKQLLTGDWEADRVVLRTEEGLAELGVRTHLGLRAVALRPGEVQLADGASLYADAIVLAPGVVARSLPGQPEQVHTLRTLDDALALRDELAKASCLLVIGAGFIGGEVATAAIGRGVSVTVLEAGPAPAVRGLGTEVAQLAARLFTEAGVDLRTGVSVTGFVDPGESGVAVELVGGERIGADVGVVGIGGRLDLDWLADTGVDVSAGLPCDSRGRVEGLERVWAVGDAATWADEDGERHRQEHWTSATDQAAVVARDILGAQLPPPAVPYVWSDQFGLKIQVIGRPDKAEQVVPLHGAGFDGGPVKGTVAGYFAGDRVVAVAGFGAARYIARYRPLVAERADRAAVERTREALS
ncbi:NADPH-dependent 2,4-dienoyl-CoA reductase, sulfur reductase [Pseudonocardia thermophila]|uniref:NADPH-dependent 2,4-dienoyl-CoA reductase, sulfur reductase n=1 Tax=Pseudonocardia thermophila TaxID=1848 RepID=A0A1M7B8Y7_PSETH|nr:FAD-dependent oxidoreductase [Pseudonocardia thermophila]SHL51109.1 NADPH-dependent 2,4-dienoyl-CoA reductase, sulfur reductase [Pseudonocardia thermophila]